MSNIEIVRKNLGPVTAYKYAVQQGYTGTEQEFAALMASYATVAQEAEESASAAADSASDAAASADAAAESARTLTIDSTLTQAGQAADAKAVGDDIGDINASLSPALSWTLKKNVDGTGSISTNDYMALSGAIPVNTGDLVTRKVPSSVDNRSIIGYLSEFNGDTFIRRNVFNTFNQKYIITDPSTTHIYLAFGRVSNTGIEITQEDVDAYFKVYVHTAVESVADFNNYAFINRGKVSDLGRTSCEQCVEQGYYTFGSGDITNIDDLPDGWTGGGILKVYKTGNVIWQNLSNNLYQFVRYGASGTWVKTLTIDSTLTQAGQAADAKAAGDIKENLSIVCPTPETTWILNRNVDGTGNISLNNYMALTYAIPVSVGDLVRRKVPSYIDNKGIIGYLSEFNGTTFIRRSSIDTEGQTYIITDPNTTEIRLSFGRVSASGITITQEDVDAYFKFEIYRKAVTYLDGLVNRGLVSNLGYTSIGQCTKQGFYTFGSSDSLSDLPTAWTGGGLILVYKNGNVIWQRLISTKYRFVRYGTTAEWRNEATLVHAQYIAESGENQSDAKLNVFVPRDLENRRTLYQMGHCVDASANADVWRIMFAYRVDTNGTQRKLTMTGEWECALHLDGRSDFSGGIVHGDEVDTDIKVFVDGTLTNIASLNAYCNELKIVRHSNLYDPNDSTTVIAEHGVEYIYTNDGLKINQSIKWRVAETLTNCFLAMLPIIKVYSKYRYDDTSFLVTENNQTNYSVTIPNAKSVTEYSTDYDCVVQMSIPVYPTGLTGGDCALVTDNGGLNYNKVYFPVCTSGTSQIGDLWKSTTIYRNK